ncbi:hypothetical protein CEXT_95951 [Caerostris extrusa]|uniref:Uncharacterized protein n=1 Tax=Caerostris extrusa TaxID=172846 RepID=A0AAV4XYK8_CAEEX|nr:hypothetical protein CEXT_95951 [Caerostris extrusa]
MFQKFALPVFVKPETSKVRKPETKFVENPDHAADNRGEEEFFTCVRRNGGLCPPAPGEIPGVFPIDPERARPSDVTLFRGHTLRRDADREDGEEVRMVSPSPRLINSRSLF